MRLRPRQQAFHFESESVEMLKGIPENRISEESARFSIETGCMNITVIKDASGGLVVKQAVAQVSPQIGVGNSISEETEHPYIQLTSRAEVTFRLPLNDAAPGALNSYREANEHYRTVPWPTPFNRTTHRLRLGDSRDFCGFPMDQSTLWSRRRLTGRLRSMQREMSHSSATSRTTRAFLMSLITFGENVRACWFPGAAFAAWLATSVYRENAREGTT